MVQLSPMPDPFGTGSARPFAGVLAAREALRRAGLADQQDDREDQDHQSQTSKQCHTRHVRSGPRARFGSGQMFRPILVHDPQFPDDAF